MFDGIGEDFSLTFSVFTNVLLGTDDYCLRAMHAVDTVHYLIEAPHLLYLLSVYVEQILLDGTVRAYTHDNYSGFFVLIAWAVDALQHIAGGFDNGYSAACRGDEPCLLEVPVLGKVFAEYICIHEYTDDASDCLLLSQFLGTSGSIV